MKDVHVRAPARNRISDDERVLRAETRLLAASEADAMTARVVCASCGREVARRARQQRFCSDRCKERGRTRCRKKTAVHALKIEALRSRCAARRRGSRRGARHDTLRCRAITVVIAGEPVAKARPRFMRRSIAYTPAQVRKYEAHGRLAAQLAMGDRPPIEAPVRLFPIPASGSGRKRAHAGDLLPTCRPDVDNYIKAGLDSLNEIVVRDDSQIVEITARKRFSIAPKLAMTVFALDAACSNRGAK
jgi:Holliday junction resolvase RusA-like endonuclease